MKKPASSFRSLLGRTRGLGSAKGGTHHWWMQRVTALALIPLTFIFLRGFFGHAVMEGYVGALTWLHSPFAATGVVLLLIAGFYHAVLGLQVVIEDYVHCEVMKMCSVIVVKFAAAVFAVLGILATGKVFFGA
jgi:succinate dehydrogenase / fumarate reductase, membrane anchor subunit